MPKAQSDWSGLCRNRNCLTALTVEDLRRERCHKCGAAVDADEVVIGGCWCCGVPVSARFNGGYNTWVMEPEGRCPHCGMGLPAHNPVRSDEE
jgi:hypothetical protein